MIHNEDFTRRILVNGLFDTDAKHTGASQRVTSMLAPFQTRVVSRQQWDVRTTPSATRPKTSMIAITPAFIPRCLYNAGGARQGQARNGIQDTYPTDDI